MAVATYPEPTLDDLARAYEFVAVDLRHAAEELDLTGRSLRAGRLKLAEEGLRRAVDSIDRALGGLTNAEGGAEDFEKGSGV